jgi:non-ribosomal peptide synthase protein (TIGR01720 family)
MSNLGSRSGVEVAIIGMAGRFPGAPDIEQFWRNLQSGVEAISFFTDEELKASGVDPALVNEKNYVKARGILESPESFDAQFFGISPREAEIIDPQHRVFLECSWEALENAGYDAEAFEGWIGVYAGSGISSYSANLFSNPELIKTAGAILAGTGNDKDHLTTRVSYKLNLTGPSITVQTACSTSLVAVCLAVQGLLSGSCDMALAGGVSISVPLKSGYLYQPGGIGSPDGHCRAFDARAQGCPGGSGCGVVVLKRLDDAIADRDFIHAVIRGSAANNDGSSKIGYTAPGLEGQAQVIRRAQILAEVEPEVITYVEAHGTGTKLGDPIEISALTRAFRARTDKKGFCALGSLKSNVGHLDTAAGVAGLIKTALSIEHGVICPSLHFEQANPEIDFTNSPFYVSTELREWKPNRGPRMAGVSSFGIGGTNAHVILEQAPPSEDSGHFRPSQLLTLSAKTNSALDKATANLARHLSAHPELRLADVAHTLNVGRKAFNYRRALVCDSVDRAARLLESTDPRWVHTRESSPVTQPIVFMFTGQGAQHLNMGRDLYESESIFREQAFLCSKMLEPHLGLDVLEVIYPHGEASPSAVSRLNDTSIAQPALFVIEYALAKTLMAWGITPSAMLGHSIGEYTAACLSGVLSLEDALALVAGRARLMQELPRGAMTAVPLSEEDVRGQLGPKLSIAAVNGPSLCVVSGPTESIGSLEARLSKSGIGCRRLHTSHAFHSPMMEPALSSFAGEVRKARLSAPDIPYIANVTGTWMTAEDAVSTEYWVGHLRNTVRFADSLVELFQEPGCILLEIGPGDTLGTLAKRHPQRSPQHLVLQTMAAARDTESDFTWLLRAVGDLWLAGAKVDWPAFYAGEERRRLPLPTYPFERKPYWIEHQRRPPVAVSAQKSLEKRNDIADWFYCSVWKQSVRRPTVSPSNQSSQDSSWVLFEDGSGFSRQVENLLRRQRGSIVTVSAGKSFGRLGDGTYVIHPESRDDYDALVKELVSLDKPLGRIVHLWSATRGDDAENELQNSEKDLKLGFYSLLLLAQALGEHTLAQALGKGPDANRIEIVVVSDGMQKVTGRENPSPLKATVLGPCRVIPMEYPNITCRSIDVLLSESGVEDGQEIAASVAREIETGSVDPVIAIRAGERYVPAYDHVRLEESLKEPPSLRSEGVYLITGGLGGIGLALAGYLAKGFRAKLALLGRSSMLDKADWNEWLERHTDQDKVSEKIRKLQEMEGAGAEVLVLKADVSDEEQMRAAILEITRVFGHINGVIHAAGVAPEGLTQRKTLKMAADVLRPKVQGVQILEKVLSGTNLDFLVLCSSLRSIVPAPGTIDYCAANAFLDSYSRHRQSIRAAPTISIHWDGWAEVGMSANTDGGGIRAEGGAGAGMLPEEGIECFRRILQSNLPNLFVSIKDLPAVIEQNAAFPSSKALAELERLTPLSSLHVRPELGSPYLAPRTELEQKLADIWQAVLAISPVGIHDNFFELGGDSVVGLQVISMANQAGLNLTPRQVFEFQTIFELAMVAGVAPPINADQGLVLGPVPLTPIQKWFFEHVQTEPSHWNQAVMFEIERPLDPALLRQTFRQILLQHDTLRLRFTRDESGWKQSIVDVDDVVPFGVHDLRDAQDSERSRAIERVAAQMQATLNLSDGPIARLALFDFGTDFPQRLLLIVHHLAIDAISWRFLIEDVYSAYSQLEEGREVALPRKTTSLQYWSSRLTDSVDSEETRLELDYWLSNEFVEPVLLPVDYSGGKNTVASACTVAVSLSVDDTLHLQREVPRIFNVQVADVLLTALVRAIHDWTGKTAILVNLEGHGREALFEDVDLSRTVGWFTSLYPVLLEIDSDGGLDDGLKSIKERLRGVPRGGVRYGLLRYLCEDEDIRTRLSSMPQPEVSFLYLGQYDQNTAGASPLKLASESLGLLQSPNGERTHLLEVKAHIAGGQLHVIFEYSGSVHRRNTIERLAESFFDSLREVIERSSSIGSAIYTASDFPGAGLTQTDLDEIINELTEFED